MNVQDTTRFVDELRSEVDQALGMIQARLSVENPEETFSAVHVIGALLTSALEQAVKRGVTGEQFIGMLRATADKLDIERQTQTGFFGR